MQQKVDALRQDQRMQAQRVDSQQPQAQQRPVVVSRAENVAGIPNIIRNIADVDVDDSIDESASAFLPVNSEMRDLSNCMMDQPKKKIVAGYKMPTRKNVKSKLVSDAASATKALAGAFIDPEAENKNIMSLD